MKIYLLSFVLCIVGLNVYSQQADQPDNSDKLIVLWTSDNVDLAKSMVFMYSYNAKRSNWFNEVTLIIWGPSAKLAAENEEIQKEIEKMKDAGVKIEVCIACAQMFGVDRRLRQLGYDVKGMGRPLTDYLKQNYKVLTF
jgi:hypothetical protein